MQVTLRKFEEFDIENKVKWINDPRNNKFLHYDLPLEVEKTRIWYNKVKQLDSRYDAVIECDGVPCGLTGLLSIDKINLTAEFYISMGVCSYKGKGVATQAGKLLLQYAFETLHLCRVYLFTEKDNVIAQHLFEKIGFRQECLLANNLCMNGRNIDRYVYGIQRKSPFNTPIINLKNNTNNLFIKRDDLIPFSFGGNKARKAYGYFDVIESKDFDCIVTYGSSSSNHCRVVSNMAAQRNIPCYIITPEEVSKPTFNSKLMCLFGAEFICCSVTEVSKTIDTTIDSLKKQGKHPYFIAGGGHGNIGTQAYVDCYNEICEYEKNNRIFFDYIFLASGTGTTQAGLICGKMMHGDNRQIIGISIARKNPRGRDVVVVSVKDYLSSKKIQFSDRQVDENVNFNDEYIGDGYGTDCEKVQNIIKKVMIEYGIPMDSTYVAKAFCGMNDFIEKKKIVNKNILFIHTGGTPLFFDSLNAME